MTWWWWWWLGCPKPVVADPTAVPAAVPAAAVPVPAADVPVALAPRLFDAAGLRDGFVLGTKLRLAVQAAGAPPVEQRWEVIEHTASGCTIRSEDVDPSTGAPLGPPEVGTSTWAELESHASFPADHTEVADDTITVPAGTFTTRRYTVRGDDGTTKVVHFAVDLPGPPVSMVVTGDGTAAGGVLFSMVLLERTRPSP